MAREIVSFPTKIDDFPVRYVNIFQGTLNIIKHRPNHQLLQNAPSGSQVSGRTAATASAAADKARVAAPRMTDFLGWPVSGCRVCRVSYV